MSTTQTTPRITLAIVDNDMMTLNLLGAQIPHIAPALKLIWKTPSGTQAIDYATGDAVCPQVLLVDMSLEDVSGVTVCREIRRRTPKPILIAMTSFSLTRYAGRAAEAGTQGIIYKSDPVQIVKTIRDIIHSGPLPCEKGPNFETPATAYARLRSIPGDPFHPLTDKERRVLELRSQFQDASQVAKALGISKGTVKTTMQHVERKLNVHSVDEAVHMWWEAEL
jgi:DNA-binding NarL/FixJ family response regulator